MKTIKCNRGGYRQVPILAGKNINIKPKTTDIASTLLAGLSHGTMGQTTTYIMVIKDDKRFNTTKK